MPTEPDTIEISALVAGLSFLVLLLVSIIGGVAWWLAGGVGLAVVIAITVLSLVAGAIPFILEGD